MSEINHELLQSLEYDGPYGARYTCAQCVHYTQGACTKLPTGFRVSGHNNVCRSFDPRIKNPSVPTFNLDDYLEFLYNDYYRPWNVDTSIVVGSARIGEVVMDGGKLAKLLPDKYSPLYKSYDKPYCRLNAGPRCYASYGDHNFEIDYRLYREQSFINEDNEVIYVVHYWKDKPTQRKYNRETNGRWSMNGENGSSTLVRPDCGGVLRTINEI